MLLALRLPQAAEQVLDAPVGHLLDLLEHGLRMLAGVVVRLQQLGDERLEGRRVSQHLLR